jgi:antitoxin ParD1/3/4
MNVRLTPQQREFIKQQVAEGRYLSDAEVIREGLRLLQEEIEWRADVRRKVADGIAQAKAGQLIDGPNAIAAVLDSLDDSTRE